MKKLLLVSILFCFAIFSVLPAVAYTPQEDNNMTKEEFYANNSAQPAYAPGRLMVKLTDQAFNSADFDISTTRSGTVTTGLASLDQLNASYGVTSMSRAHIDVANQQLDDAIGVSRWHIIYVPESTDIEFMADAFAADWNVEAAHPDYQAFPMLVPNDTYYADQWGHNNTGQMDSYDWSTHTHTGPEVGTPGFDGNVEAAWDALGGFGSSSVIIGIIDSGVDVDHPDLDLVAGYDYGDNDSNPDDNSSQAGHGTACAGVAAAIADNGIGVAGVAGGSKVMPLKVADSQGSMYFSAIQNALYHAADNGANIASMSLGAAISSDAATDDALQYAYNAGVTLLAATGNENNSTISYPAINQYVIAIGAASPCDGRKRSSSSATEVNSGVSTDPNGYSCDGERWWGSNYGSTTQDAAGAVDVIAPTILPATDIGGSGGYDSGDYSLTFNGTSCATPFAAGVAGLILSANPSFTPAQVRQQMVDTADDVVNIESTTGWDRYSGYGMINAGAALGGNIAPQADANGPYSADPGVSINFSSAGSSDPDGSIVSYHWDFGDGATSTLANPSHAYAAEGFYTATLTCTDNEGASGVATANVTIGNPCSGVAAADGDIVLNLVTDRYASETSWDLKDSGGTTINSGSGYSNSSTYNINLGPLSEGQYTFTIYDSYGDGICCAYGSGSYELVDGASNVLVSGGAFGSSESTVFCVPSAVPNEAPTAEANGPYSADEDVAISFSSAGSSDADGSIVSYSWNFGDGGSSTAANPTYTYANPGTYTVTLTVTDDDGATGSDTATATISDVPNVAPTAEANGPYSGEEGTAIAFSSAGSSDSDGSIASYSWDFGDGNSSTEANPSHAYAAAGTYTVTLTVTDNEGATGSDTATAEVTTAPQNVAPTAEANGPYTGTEGAAIAFSSAGSSDSDGSIASYSWDFGDGSTSAEANPSHAYLVAGTYTATLTVTDNDGATGSDTATVTVEGQSVTYMINTIAMSQRTSGPWTRVTATITVTSGGSPVSGATVNATWSGSVSGSVSGTTGPDGTVAFEDKSRDNNYSFTITVDDVSAAGYTWDTANSELSETLASGAGSNGFIPTALSLQNYPNPFNPSTTIAYAVPVDGHVSLTIYNTNGQLVRTLVNASHNAGAYTIKWDGSNDNGIGVSSGTYFYTLEVNGQQVMNRMQLLK